MFILPPSPPRLLEFEPEPGPVASSKQVLNGRSAEGRAAAGDRLGVAVEEVFNHAEERDGTAADLDVVIFARSKYTPHRHD